MLFAETSQCKLELHRNTFQKSCGQGLMWLSCNLEVSYRLQDMWACCDQSKALHLSASSDQRQTRCCQALQPLHTSSYVLICTCAMGILLKWTSCLFVLFDCCEMPMSEWNAYHPGINYCKFNCQNNSSCNVMRYRTSCTVGILLKWMSCLFMLFDCCEMPMSEWNAYHPGKNYCKFNFQKNSSCNVMRYRTSLIPQTP